MYKKINSYFLIFIIMFSMLPVQAVAPIKYYEIDSDIELRGAIFVNVDPTGFYASLNNGVIQIDSDNHIDNVMIRFKGIALNVRLKKYNGFNVGYTHITDNGISTHELKPLKIDYQGFTYLNTDFSTVIINGVTGTTTTTLTGLSGNKSISVPDGSSYEFNITNNQEGVWTAASDALGNTSTFENRTAYTINHSGALSDYQIKLNNTVTNSDRWTYENGTYISNWNETLLDVWVKSSLNDGDTILYKYDGINELSSGSNGSDTFIQYHSSTAANYIESLILPHGNAFIYESRVKVTSATHNQNWGIANTQDRNDDSMFIQAVSGDAYIYLRSIEEGVFTELSPLVIDSFTVNQYYTLKMTFDATTLRGYRDGTEFGTGITTGFPNEYMGIFMRLISGTAVQDWAFVRQYVATEPTVQIGTPQQAQGATNITASVTGDNNAQNYNTSQSREFTLTPTGATNNVLINTTSIDYDVTIITYWTDDTTQYSQTSDSGYVKSYINYTSVFPISTAIFNDTINLGIHNFSDDDYIGTINATINDSYISAIRNDQEINATAYNLIEGIDYLINFTIPINNIQTVGNVTDIEAFLCIPYSLTAPTFYDPENLGIDNETWHFGDGDISSSSSPTHTYLTLGNLVGNYSVTEIATILPQTVTKEFNVSVLVQPVQNLTSQVEQTYINFNWSDYECADYWNVSELEESVPYSNTTIILDGNKDVIYDTNAHAFAMHSPNPTTNLDYELVYWFRNSTHLIGWATGYDNDNLPNDDYFLIGIDGGNDNLTVNDRKFILSESGTVTAKRWGGSAWLPTSTNAEGAVVGGGVAGVITYEMIIPISEMAGFVDDATIKFYMERECSSLTPTVETFYPLNLINSTDATIWATAILTEGEVYNYIGNTSISEFNSTGLDLYSWYKHCFITINGTTESTPIYSYDVTAGAQHYSVSGFTKDTLGNIISGVTVFAQNGHVMEATQSDINGYWEGINFHFDNYTVYGNKSGYQENFTNVYVTGNLTNQNITLTAFTITDWEIYQQLLLLESQNNEILLNMSINNTIVNDKLDTILIFILLNMAVIVGIIIGRRGKENDN